MSTELDGAFVRWALSKERTQDELVAADYIVDAAATSGGAPQPANWGAHYEQQLQKKRHRALNPAYVPELTEEMLFFAARGMRTRTSWSFNGSSDDWPMRTIDWLRFFPHITDLNFSESDIRDFSPLVHVPELTKLHVMGNCCRDLRPLRHCTKLENLQLTLRRRWPDLRGIEELKKLEILQFQGNILALENLQPLENVRFAYIAEWLNNGVLRDLCRLPEMPRLEVLKVEQTDSLEGIGRYPALLNFNVAGGYEDLSPLAACKNLTHLVLRASLYFLEHDCFRDLAPLARLPELRELTVESKLPRDYIVLVEAPKLRRLILNGCETGQTEADALNAGLEPWDSEFAAPAPRPLPPLGFFVHEDYKDYDKRPVLPALEPVPWQHNPAYRFSESDWIVTRITRKIEALMNGKRWGECGERFRNLWSYYLAPNPGHPVIDLEIKSQEAAERLDEIVQIVREELARTRRRMEIALRVNVTVCDEEDFKRTPEQMEQDLIEEDREWNEQRRRLEEFIKRKHEYELRRKAGMKIEPGEFADPDAPPPAPAAGPEPEVFVENAGEKDERWIDREEHPLFDGYLLFAHFDEATFTVQKQSRKLAFLLLGIPD